MARTRILVVDDEPDILELVQYNLSKAQYDVVGVESGEEALAQARITPPDLIVLDLMLPGVDGLEVCKTLKRDTRTAVIPIVILTARGEEADRVLGDLLRQNVTEIKLLQEHLHDSIAQLIYDRTGRRPMILPVIVEV